MEMLIQKANLKRNLIFLIFLTAATLFVFWNIGSHDFINFDDDEYVTENPFVQKGFTADNILQAFGFSPEAIKFYWHPVTWLSHMLDYRLFGLNAGMHHLMNLFFHILSACILFAALQKLTGAFWRSAFAAMLFAVHPINVESVAWIAERKNVLSTFFWMLALLAYIYHAKQPSLRKYVLILIPFILGLMTKPMLITLPCVFLLLDFWPTGRFNPLPNNPQLHPAPGGFPRQPFHRILMEKIPLFLLSLTAVAVSIKSIRINAQITSIDNVPMALRFENALVSYVKYIQKILVPHDFSVFYPFPKTIPDWQAAAAGLLLVAITAAALILIRKAPYLIAGWLWYLGTLFPVSGISQHARWPAMADRWAYVPEIGLFIMIAWGTHALLYRLWNRREIFPVAALAVILIMMLIARGQVSHWENSITLFRHALSISEDNYLAHFNLGTALAGQGNHRDAIYHYRQSIAAQPSAEVHNNLGNELARADKMDEALSHYAFALQINPEYVEANINIGNAFAEKKEWDKAIQSYSRAIELNPELGAARENLAKVFLSLNQLQKAKEQFLEILRTNPADASAHNGLGVIFAREKNIDQAIMSFEKALAVDPESVFARQNLNQLTAYRERVKQTASDQE